MENLKLNEEVGQPFIQTYRVSLHEGKLVSKLESGDKSFDVFVTTKIKRALKNPLAGPMSFEYQDSERSHYEVMIIPDINKSESVGEVLIVKKRSGQGSIESLIRENNTLQSFKRAIDKHSILMVINKQGKIVEVNEMFLQLSGYKEDEILLSPVKILNSGYHSKKFWKDIWKRVLKGETIQEEIRNVGKLGNYFWLNTTIVPVFDEYDRFQYFVSISHNITDLRNEFRKKLEKQFQLATLGKVTARFSHEINNPLTIISSLGSKLKLTGKTEELVHDGQLILDNIKRIESISSSIRRASRRGQKLKMDEINLGDVFNHLISIFSLKCKEEGVLINFVSNHNLVYGNYDYVIQILINLVNNSFDSLEETENPCIRISVEEDDHYIYLCVRDNGPLINDLIMKEIFQEFFTTKESLSGTGIGLSLSKDMAQKMGGDLYLEQVGKNKDFILKLNKYQNGDRDE